MIVTKYLDCGRPIGGFARIRCESCREEHLRALSCRTRNLCASCQSKRSLLFGERLRTEIAVPVAHRHVVFTIPKVLRGPFERERSLLGVLARAAYETVRRVLKAAGEGKAAVPTATVPGFVASIQTFGSYATFHPHAHALVAEGVLARDGAFHAVAWPPSGVLEEAFRRLLLAALERAERLTEEFAANLASWRHSGFSVYAASRVDALDLDRLEPCPPVGRRSRTTSARAGAARERRTARYVTRPALENGAVTIREDGRVDVATPLGACASSAPRSRRFVASTGVVRPPDPRTGATSRTRDALDFVHAVVTQIPDGRAGARRSCRRIVRDRRPCAGVVGGASFVGLFRGRCGQDRGTHKMMAYRHTV